MRRMRTEYRTLEIHTVAGWDELERMVRNGWNAYRVGLFYAYLSRRRAV